MDSLRRMLGLVPARTCPPRNENDLVYPVHILDAARISRSYQCSWILRFDDVLDPQLLHTSLAKLLDIGDWKKVGGRILRDDGGLEIHVPRPFSDARPAVSFFHKNFAIPIQLHDVAKTLPQATCEPSLQLASPDLRAFAVAENGPESFDDYIYSDRPQIGLHITSFDDATLVGLSWPHTLMDAMGQQALLKAWSLVIAGREAEVPALLGAREEVLYAAVDAPSTKREVPEIVQMQSKGWRLLMWMLRLAWDLVCDRVAETRTIVLPRNSMDKLRQQAREELSVLHGQDTFVSDGDILTAWACRGVAFSLPRPRPLTVAQAVNLRFRLPCLINAPGLFVQNTTVAAAPVFSAIGARASLGSIALEHRKQLARQVSEAQVLGFLRYLRDECKLNDDLLPGGMFGPSDAVLVSVSNWARADIFNVIDFSAAVVWSGGQGRTHTHGPGMLTSQYFAKVCSSPPMRNTFVVLGEDKAGNCWVQAHLVPRTWAKMEELVREIS